MENITLSCNASGFPAPSIVWNYNGSLLMNDRFNVVTVELDSYRVQSSLSVLLANVSDTGIYTCTAISNVDNSSISEDSTLIVQGNIAIFSLPFMHV